MTRVTAVRERPIVFAPEMVRAIRGYGWDANPWLWVISFRRVE